MRDTFLPYCRPTLDQRDIDAVTDALRNDWLTTGPKTHELEARFAELAGVGHAIAVNSATAGLHLVLVALGVGPGDEVVLPALSFVAAAHCVRHCGATPVFCDVEPDTLCLSVSTVQAVVTAATKAIVTMPYAGRPVGIASLAAYACARSIAVIEDAALGVGTLDAGEWPGRESGAAVISFYATKNITTAEGGIVLTDDEALAVRLRRLALHGMDRDAWKRYTAGGTWRYDVTETGFKYNMPDLAAALGLAQLAKLDEMQRRREEIAARYVEALDAMPGISPAALGRLGPRDRHSWCFFPISIDPESGLQRDAVVERLRKAQIGTSVHYIPSHLFAAYAGPAYELPVTDRTWPGLLSLPLYPRMTDDDVESVCTALAAIVAREPAYAT